jgi:hypothetical protein
MLFSDIYLIELENKENGIIEQKPNAGRIYRWTDRCIDIGKTSCPTQQDAGA